MTFGRNCTAQYLIPYHLSAVQLGSGFICPQYREFLEFPASGYNIWADVRGTPKFPHGNKDWKPSRSGGLCITHYPLCDPKTSIITGFRLACIVGIFELTSLLSQVSAPNVVGVERILWRWQNVRRYEYCDHSKPGWLGWNHDAEIQKKFFPALKQIPLRSTFCICHKRADHASSR
jgi:hypothetical protein